MLLVLCINHPVQVYKPVTEYILLQETLLQSTTFHLKPIVPMIDPVYINTKTRVCSKNTKMEKVDV